MQIVKKLVSIDTGSAAYFIDGKKSNKKAFEAALARGDKIIRRQSFRRLGIDHVEITLCKEYPK